MFNPSINLLEEAKWLLPVTFFEVTNSLFKITNENNSFSSTIPGHWETQSPEKTFEELSKFLELRSQNGIVLHVEQVRKKSKILLNDSSLSSLGSFENQILEEVKSVKYNDLEDLLYRFQLTYGEIIDFLDLKFIPTKRTSYSLNPGINEISDVNTTLKYILPDNVKASIIIDDIRLKSNLKSNQTLFFTSKKFFL